VTFIYILLNFLLGFPGDVSGKEPTCQFRRLEFNPWVRKSPWRRKWQLTPVFLPGESHGWRSLAGYSPYGHRVGHDWVTKHKLSTKLWGLVQHHQKLTGSYSNKQYFFYSPPTGLGVSALCAVIGRAISLIQHLSQSVAIICLYAYLYHISEFLRTGAMSYSSLYSLCQQVSDT